MEKPLIPLEPPSINSEHKSDYPKLSASHTEEKAHHSGIQLNVLLLC